MSEPRVPEGGGIIIGLLAVVPFWLAVWLMAGCAWTPVVHRFPESGLTVVRGDSTLVAQACGTRGHWDNGEPQNGRAPIGCYRRDIDTIYVRNTNDGAKALTHELAHRDGIKDPSAGGYDW